MIDWLNNLPPATVPAWLGFLLSFGLLVVKLWELHRDRSRVLVGGDFASLDSVGNHIHIRNLSPKPVILVYWEVFYATKPLLFRKTQYVGSAEDSQGATIAPGTTYTRSFTDENHF